MCKGNSLTNCASEIELIFLKAAATKYAMKIITTFQL